MNIERNILNKNLDNSIANKCKSEFHRQILSAWINTYCKEPPNYKEIVNQFLVYNKAIKINRKYKTPILFKSNDINITYNIKILNMLNPQNMFLNIQDFNSNNSTRISVLEYNALKSCIPSAWKKLFLQNNNPIQKTLLEPSVQIGMIKKPISIIKSKELYQNLIMEKNKPPTSIETWVNRYPFYETL